MYDNDGLPLDTTQNLEGAKGLPEAAGHRYDTRKSARGILGVGIHTLKESVNDLHLLWTRRHYTSYINLGPRLQGILLRFPEFLQALYTGHL